VRRGYDGNAADQADYGDDVQNNDDHCQVEAQNPFCRIARTAQEDFSHPQHEPISMISRHCRSGARE
jgi:hypothetical protein